MFGRNKPPKVEDYDVLDEHLKPEITGFPKMEVDEAALNGKTLGAYVSDHGQPGTIYTHGGKAYVFNRIAQEVTAQLKEQGG